jgi:hypothetical protein
MDYLTFNSQADTYMASSWQGVSSCAATACHGDSGLRGSKRSEYLTWVTYDKHASAYSVLLTRRSQLIETNYRGHKVIEQAHPETDMSCLKCHALMSADHRLERHLQDGVACESCHGPAEKWRTVHYLPGFKEKSDQEKYQEFGMLPTKNLLYRARMCAECHVGSPGREVNHDLYAAGHPPLHFEFGAYLAIMPKHWSEEEEKRRHPDLEVKAWALGQALSARAALQLLAWRAETKTRPWPEYAEYGCYACHHDLRAKSQRQEPRHYAGRRPGALLWGEWFTTNLSDAVDSAIRVGDLSNLQEGLAKIKAGMAKPFPDRDEIAQQANRLAGRLEQLAAKLEEVQFNGASVDKMIRSVAERELPADPTDWDKQAQVCLALAALYHGLGDLDPNRRDPAMKEHLKMRLNRLAFPPGFDSPWGFGSKSRE